MDFIIFSVSDSASGFSSTNHEWSCIPACLFLCERGCFFLFFFLSSSLHSRLKATRRPWLQRWSALVVSGLQMFGFLRGAAGDHATGHGAWTPKQLFPIVLESGADLYSSHSATTGYRTSVTAPDTPTVRKSSPAGSEAIVARRQTHGRHKTVDWCLKKKKSKKIRYISFCIFPPTSSLHANVGSKADVRCTPTVVMRAGCVRHTDWRGGGGSVGAGVRDERHVRWRSPHRSDQCVTGFDREHSSINVKESCATKSKVPQWQQRCFTAAPTVNDLINKVQFAFVRTSKSRIVCLLCNVIFFLSAV